MNVFMSMVSSCFSSAVTLVNKFGVDEELPEDFTANKPFLFFIEDDNTKQVLFSGTVNDPTKTIGELEEKPEGKRLEARVFSVESGLKL